MKVRVSVSVSAPTLKAAEQAGRKRGIRSRSAVVEEALKLLATRTDEAELDAALDAYYGTAPTAERVEERAMVAAFNRSQRRRDLDREGD